MDERSCTASDGDAPLLSPDPSVPSNLAMRTGCPCTCPDIAGGGKTGGRGGLRAHGVAGFSMRRAQEERLQCVVPHSNRTGGVERSRLQNVNRFLFLRVQCRRVPDVASPRQTRLKAESARASHAWAKVIRVKTEPARKDMTMLRASVIVVLNWHAHLVASRLSAGAQCRIAGASGNGGVSVVPRPQYGLGRRSMTRGWRLQPHACTSSHEPVAGCAVAVTMSGLRTTA